MQTRFADKKVNNIIYFWFFAGQINIILLYSLKNPKSSPNRKHYQFFDSVFLCM